jgi:hypothetical protein
MRLPYLEAICTLALISGCPAKDEGDSDPQGSSSSSGAPQTGTDGGATDTSEPPVTDTGDPPGTDTDGGPDDTGDATVGDETVGDETVGDETVGDDTGPAVPGECVETDPAVSAAFALDLTAWPIDPDDHFFADVPCVVDAVTSAGGTVSTALTCTHEGVPVVAVLDVAEAPEGAVMWAVADEVKLSSSVSFDGLEESSSRLVQLRSGEDLLMSGVDETNGDAVEGRFKPLVVHFDEICLQQEGDEYPVRIEFDPTDAPSIFIFSGHRGLLETGSEADFAIDVEKAISNGLHDIEFKVLLRKVATGG